MKAILLGPPGAGKGTQSVRISEVLSIPRISSGDLFRDHQRRDTELGRLARSYMERGILVPDDVSIEMVMEWVDSHQHAGGFLLDGFPRTLAQAKALDAALAVNEGIDKVFYIRVQEEELTRRLNGRLICKGCQVPYHTEKAPPKRVGMCNLCNSELYQRDDDKPEAVRKRIQVYIDETEPLVEYYRSVNILQEVDGDNSIEEVSRSLVDAIS